MTLHFGSWDDVIRTMYVGIVTFDGGWRLGKQKIQFVFCAVVSFLTQNTVSVDDNLQLFFLPAVTFFS